ncbi:2-phospho-L-lactate transferase [Virgisporangium ochraceum]|uniref:2-phospho-L-lactate transferase n=1 Tax=Virgisporangium ochraceum TaxID=65505 RepID=A0A8J3ZMJ2_9ACTN|nr:2-phospho-L-lactate transferase [Virgisporangium ochraceum]GIJ67069.1 2-phospho-L-lactate transferase [Virgisporangium ochraceum]
MRIVVLAGGVGGARFLSGVRAWASTHQAATQQAATQQAATQQAPTPRTVVTAIVNVGDNVTMHGLRICPDLDTVMYTLGGGNDRERGWGRAGESWVVKDELAAYGGTHSWFGLGDRDLATHLVRTRMLAEGRTLSEATAELCRRWRPGIEMLPASDDHFETHVVTPEGTMHFQEWWVRHRGVPEVVRFEFDGAATATAAPGVLAAIADADLVLVGPSNPVVSIGPILAVPGVRDAITKSPARVVGVSGIIGDAPVLGMADRCLRAVGVACSAAGVGGLYGARSSGGLLDGWLVDTVDAGTTVEGLPVRAMPLWMRDDEATAAMVAAAVELAAR